METAHRYFVQYMLKHRSKSLEEAYDYYKSLTGDDSPNDTLFRTFVHNINQRIVDQYFKMVFLTCELTSVDYLLFVNLKDDDIAKQQISFDKTKLEYFHVLMQEMLNTERHHLNFTTCLNLVSMLATSNNFSRESAQNVLHKWMESRYFVKKGRNVYLGPMLIAEFASYLKAHYSNSICNLCSELVFVGKICISCHKTMHSYCLAKYLGTQDECPNCQQKWMDIDDPESEEE